MTDLTTCEWRVGSHIGRTVYAVTGTTHDEHPLIGLFDTPELAAEAVQAHNQRIKEQLVD